ncbi:hypothetical protein EGR_02687 [Echinococcus granulosus]|uniref:Uncharacterized protein n=1 Tax=Echinococcus granulosus TaxID=6210 RepID=W6ULY8_ECHGR|nr:hypothetical protein EGR_02687 [Echinococcus granulosus]EUB62555.1 hypothetical protein EGR_02687 [Echinococcus granulosus]
MHAGKSNFQNYIAYADKSIRDAHCYGKSDAACLSSLFAITTERVYPHQQTARYPVKIFIVRRKFKQCCSEEANWPFFILDRLLALLGLYLITKLTLQSSLSGISLHFYVLQSKVGSKGVDIEVVVISFSHDKNCHRPTFMRFTRYSSKQRHKFSYAPGHKSQINRVPLLLWKVIRSYFSKKILEGVFISETYGLIHKSPSGYSVFLT